MRPGDEDGGGVQGGVKERVACKLSLPSSPAGTGVLHLPNKGFYRGFRLENHFLNPSFLPIWELLIEKSKLQADARLFTTCFHQQTAPVNFREIKTHGIRADLRRANFISAPVSV